MSIRRKKFSKATDGSGGCPKCGSVQFTAKRSKKAKAIGVVTVGVGALAAPKSQVKCVGCGAMYRRA